MINLGEKAVQWLSSNQEVLLPKSLLRHNKVRWGGTFKAGDSVPPATAVIREHKVYVAVSDKQDRLPEPGAKGFHLLVDLKASSEGNPLMIPLPTISGEPENREQALIRGIVKYAIHNFDRKIRDSKIEGTNLWRGIFKSGQNYSSGDMVCYNGKVYVANSGNGVPGRGSGWKRALTGKLY